jgi:hypothetical protein
MEFRDFTIAIRCRLMPGCAQFAAFHWLWGLYFMESECRFHGGTRRVQTDGCGAEMAAALLLCQGFAFANRFPKTTLDLESTLFQNR